MTKSAIITYLVPGGGQDNFIPGTQRHRLFIKYREIMDFNHPLKLLFDWLEKVGLFEINAVLQVLEWTEPIWDMPFDPTMINICLKEMEEQYGDDMRDKLNLVGNKEQRFCKKNPKKSVMDLEQLRSQALKEYAPECDLEMENIANMLSLVAVIARMCRRSQIKPHRTRWQRFKDLFRPKWKQLL